jgi:hypothetical protein
MVERLVGGEMIAQLWVKVADDPIAVVHSCRIPPHRFS